MNDTHEPAAQLAPPGHPDGFVSYSRSDQDAVLAIVRAAEGLDRSLWVDNDDIPGAAAWRDELTDAIGRSDAFICFLSPAWLSSVECRREYDRAIELGKRLVPVLIADTQDPPPELAALQWIDARAGTAPEQVATAVLAAIDVDHERVREHTLWLSRALRWEAGGSDRSQLLRGKDLSTAEAWLAQNRADPAPTPLHNQFIAASRQAERRRLRATVTAALVAVVVTLLFAAGALLQWRRAETEAEAARRQTAIAEAQLAASRSTSAGTVWAALAFAVEAELRTPEPLPEARSVMAGALQRLARQPVRPLGRMQVDDIEAAAWSPTEHRLLTAAHGATQLWDMPSRIPVGAPKQIMDRVETIEWSPDGRLLAASGGKDLDDVVMIFTVADNAAPSMIYHDMPGLVTSLAWSPDGARLAIGGGAGVLTFDIVSGRLDAAPLIPVKEPKFLSWSPDGRLLALVADNRVQIFDAGTGSAIGPPLTDGIWRVFSIAWSPTGARLAGRIAGHTVQLWDVPQSLTPTRPSRGHGGTFRELAWSPDGATIASVEPGGAMRFSDGGTGAPIGDPVPSNTVQLSDLGWSADGTQLAARGLDDTVRFWTPRTAGPLKLLDGEVVKSVAWSPGGDRIAAAGKYGTVHILDARSGAAIGPPLTPTPTSEMNAVAWSPREDRLAIAADRGPIRIWDARTGAPVLTLADSALGADDVAWSPDGTRLAACRGSLVLRIWDATTGQLVLDLQNDNLLETVFDIDKIAWSPDGLRLATAGKAALRTWDAGTGQPLGPRLQGHEAPVRDVSWSPDSTRVASSGLDATMRRWDVRAGTALGAPSTLQDRAGAVGLTDVAAVAWSPSGTEIATGDSDGELRLWSAATGTPVGDPIDTGASYVYSMAWSPDGRQLAASSTTGITLWESVPERVACQFALDALANEGLQAIATGASAPLRCTNPGLVPDLPPLPVLPQPPR